jgi:hypothetical protein
MIHRSLRGRPLRVAFLVGLVELTVLAAGVGRAQAQAQKPSPEAIAEANRHAERARRFYEIRHYDEAAQEFDQAYRIDGDPSHLYNLAQSYRLSNHPSEALQCYELYLQRMPTAPNRADIERRIGELRAAAGPAPAPAQGQAPAAPPSAPATAPQPGPPPQGYPGNPPQGYPAGGYPPQGQYPQGPYGGPGSGQGYPPPYPGPPGPPGTGGMRVGAFERPGAHEHDGFFLRAQLGAGYLNSTTNAAISSSLKGTAGAFALSLGWALSKSLVLYGELYDAVVTDPTVEIGGISGTGSGDVTMSGYGLGAAFYVVPANAYLSLTISTNRLELKTGDRHHETNFGPGALLSVGKEWWVSRDLGIGAAVQAHYSSVKDSDLGSSFKWNTFWAAAVFSLTLN